MMITRSEPIKRSAPLKRSTKPIKRTRIQRGRPLTMRNRHPDQPSDAYVLGLLAKAVKIRDPRCVVCRQRPTTDAMHMIGRSARRVRHSLDNVLGGCRQCHASFSPAEWREWWEARIGKARVAALRARAQDMNVKPDLSTTAEILRWYIKENS